MPTLFVCCPETTHPELIEYDDSPIGMLLTRCSRFRPASAVTCPRTCCAGALASEDPTIANREIREDCTRKSEPRMQPFVLDVKSLLRDR